MKNKLLFCTLSTKSLLQLVLLLMMYFGLFQITLAQTDPISIAVARTKSLNTVVTVAGRVTVGNQFNNLVYIQDQTGGIPVFGTSIASALTIGDSVVVKGPISTFNQQLQIGTAGQTFTKVNVAKRIVSPKVITLAEAAANEGMLVSIQNVAFAEKSFVFTPNSNYAISANGQTGELRINAFVNLVGRTKPQSAVTTTGVMGRFNSIYQLLPRFIEDLPGTTEYVVAASNIARSKTFNVATWNMNWFGNTSNGPTDETLQQNNAKVVLDSLKADLYVVEEVANLPAFRSLVAKLSGYKGFCATSVSQVGNLDDNQRVCFIYRTAVVDSVGAKVLLKGANNLPNYPENKPEQFWASGRLPFLFICDATIQGVKKRLHVVGIHARANTGTTLAENELKYRQRRYDVEVLKDTLDAQYKSANVLLVGDYNDDVDETVSDITSTKESSYIKMVQDTANYQPITKALSDAGFRTYLTYGNVIDHITVSKNLKSAYLKNSAGVELAFRYITNYATTTSDHIPVVARFDLGLPITALHPTLSQEVVVFPNPTNGALRWTNSTPFQEARIYSLTGILISQNTLVSQDIDLSVLPTGTYLVELRAGDGVSVRRLVWKQ
ncbi:MAG: DUF5689 domain-containing protein [Spirosomataceae bacterium]